MKEFEGKTAIVTGAASGIGLGLAEKFAKERMQVVMADVEEEALNKAFKFQGQDNLFKFLSEQPKLIAFLESAIKEML